MDSKDNKKRVQKMGLAASQARLLTITSRKSDVESNLTNIANQKLAMSRQSAALSQAYSDALSAKKMTWDVTSTTATPLTYDLLMTPNDTNTQGQYLIADAYGRVMLDDSYAQYFNGGDSSITSGGNTNGVSCAQFLLDVMPDKYTSLIDAQKGQKLAEDGVSKSGTKLDKMSTDVTTLLSYYISDPTYKSGSTQTTYNDNTYEAFKKALGTVAGDLTSEIQNIANLSDSQINYLENTNLWTSLKFGDGADDTLTSDTFKDKMGCVSTGGTYSKENYSDEYKELEYLVRMLRGVKAAQKALTLYTSTTPITSGNSSDTTALTTITSTISLLLKGGSPTSYTTSTPGEPANMLMDGQDTGNGASEAHVVNDNDDDKTFANYFDYNQNGVWNGASMDATNYSYSDGKLMFTEDTYDLFSNYSTLRTARENSNPTTTSDNKTLYYVDLWKAINNQGWVTTNNMGTSIDPTTKKQTDKDTDGTYLQNLLLNSGAYLYKLDSTTGKWKLSSTSDTNSPVNTETDDDAISAAEANYDAGKDRLTYQENQLDIKSNDLDTERAALNTEMESVQKLIDSNVKVLKMFSSSA